MRYAFSPYYAENYAGIIDTSLLTSDTKIM